jgi:hypothetical protein
MEADLNFPNKLFFGKRMMDWADENEEHMPVEAYGSWKHHQSIDMSISRCVSLDIFCQKRIPAAITSLDAANCYDRLAHNMTSLACQCLGLQTEMLTCLLLTIQLMNFFLCTAFSDSTSSYGGRCSILRPCHSPFLPLQGACQGNGGGPAMFFSICIVLIGMMYVNSHIATIVCAISGLEVHFAGTIFVNDVDLITAARCL